MPVPDKPDFRDPLERKAPRGSQGGDLFIFVYYDAIAWGTPFEVRVFAGCWSTWRFVTTRKSSSSGSVDPNSPPVERKKTSTLKPRRRVPWGWAPARRRHGRPRRVPRSSSAPECGRSAQPRRGRPRPTCPGTRAVSGTRAPSLAGASRYCCDLCLDFRNERLPSETAPKEPSNTSRAHSSVSSWPQTPRHPYSNPNGSFNGIFPNGIFTTGLVHSVRRPAPAIQNGLWRHLRAWNFGVCGQRSGRVFAKVSKRRSGEKKGNYGKEEKKKIFFLSFKKRPEKTLFSFLLKNAAARLDLGAQKELLAVPKRHHLSVATLSTLRDASFVSIRTSKVTTVRKNFGTRVRVSKRTVAPLNRPNLRESNLGRE